MAHHYKMRNRNSNFRCSRGAAILGRNGRYQKNNPTADENWNQSILPLNYGATDTYFITDELGNILTDDNGNQLVWRV